MNDSDNFIVLENLCDENAEFFKNYDSKTEYGLHIQNLFKQWGNLVQSAKWKCEKIEEFSHEYDFDDTDVQNSNDTKPTKSAQTTQGNGYRSFIKIINKATQLGITLCKNIQQDIFQRKQLTLFLFRKNYYRNELESQRDLFESLCTCLDYLFIMHEWSDYGSLFINNQKYDPEDLFESGEKINQYCFYGRHLGFQYTKSMQAVLRGLSICMASYSETYYSKIDSKLARTTSSAWTSSKYFWNPDLRAKRIVNISHSADVDFCKSFWFLAESELMHKIPSIFGSSIEINKVIEIPPEPLQIENVETGELVSIPIPSSHIPSKSISGRLLSSQRREGMIGVSSNANKKRRSSSSSTSSFCSHSSVQPASKNLIIHCHGGGFVAQSSKSHELYLRDWAASLNAPILSIDYSLAPEAPYPRALEEIFYVYCWALKNSNLLGTSAERVVFAGDSAGANLCIATIFKCVDYGIRKPDGLFIAYCPVYLDFVPSPARMLCLMDPLLPFGFMIRCMKAYACVDEKATEALECDFEHSVSNDKLQNGQVIVTKNDDDNNIQRQLPTNNDDDDDDIDDDEKTIKSLLSDVTSDTFASASYQSQEMIENPDLLTPEIPSSCISMEDDSQPIMKLSQETLSNVTTPPIDSDEKNLITTVFMPNINQTQDFIEINQQNTMTKTPSEENIIFDISRDVLSPKSIQGRLHKAATEFVEMISSAIKNFTNSSEIKSQIKRHGLDEAKIKNLDLLIARNPGTEYNFKVPNDFYISPYIASDEYLKQIPTTRILTLDMDPCLDDGIMFAKRLKKLGNNVKIDILEGLPHGFLNFTMLSKEANEGSKICSDRIAELLNDDEI